MNRLSRIMCTVLTLIMIITIALTPYGAKGIGGTCQDDDDYYHIEVVCSDGKDRT